MKMGDECIWNVLWNVCLICSGYGYYFWVIEDRVEGIWDVNDKYGKWWDVIIYIYGNILIIKICEIFNIVIY